MDRNIKEAIDAVILKGATYADIRCSDKEITSLMQKNGKIENITTGTSFSAGFRVLYKGSWGFASTDNVSRLAGIADTAFRIAKSMQDANKSKDVVLAETKTVEKNIDVHYKTDLKNMSIDDRINFAREGHKGAMEVSDKIKSVSLMYGDSCAKNVFASSEGTYITSSPQYFKYYVFSTAKQGDRREEFFDRYASFSGIDELIQRDPAKIGASASREAVKLLGAVHPPSGKMPVILHPTVGGLFVHEAVGHASEADHAMKESIFNSKLGEKIGSDKLNITDNSTLAGKHGSYMYDDEGVRGKKTVIFRNGVLKSYLNSRETAGSMGVEPTGNGRAQSPSFRPIVRMSNTYFDKGDMETDELFEGVKKGVYMKGFKGGEVNPVDGTFTFGVEQGYIIENGKKTKLVKDCAMSGLVLDVLKNIDAVGKDLWIDGIGFCGKEGQYVPVCDGGPHFRVSELLVGGQR